MTGDVLHIDRVQAWAYRQPVESPVATSFGIMRTRPAVFVRIEDTDGAFGWGEIFANWPASGAEHRCRLLAEDLGDLLTGVAFAGPADLFDRLTTATRIRALQCGEPGPFAQVIAGLDTAAWDLCARRAGLPLRTHLNAGATDRVPAYASGIAIAAAPEMIAQARGWGFDAVKVKIGFGAGEPARLARLRDDMGADCALMVDANQAWDEAEAMAFLTETTGLHLDWVEEPVIAIADPDIWKRLAAATPTPLAGGENLAGLGAFEAAIAERSLSVVQPDVAKWGGITGCRRVAERVRAAGLRYCPHFLGGGIGLAASAHLLAAAGGDGRLEVDINPNALRDAFGPVRDGLRDGLWDAGHAPGLGIETLPEAIEEYRTHTVAVSRKGRS
ncbi:MAG: mandelate racemase/muconate lactonizing enzyme family protein [Jannaschia sp.]